MPSIDVLLLQKLVIIVVILVGTLIVARLLSKFLDKWVRRAVSRSKSELDDTLLNALKSPLAYFVLLVGLWLALQQADL
jgi:small-conductance mechanosensitive channel